MIYLDYQATTPVAPEVAEAMQPWLSHKFANPHSPSRWGREAAAAIEAIRAAFNASNAYLAANSTLGRPLAGGAANITIDLVEPYTVFLERRNELDMRFGKLLRAGRSRSIVSVDVYNMFNIDTVVNANQNFAVWQRPTQILNGRTVKFSVQFDY